MENGPVPNFRTSPFHETIAGCRRSVNRRSRMSLAKSLGFDWWLRSWRNFLWCSSRSCGSWGSGAAGGATGRAGGSSGTTAGGGWSTAGLWSGAATGTSWLAATNLCSTAAATSFGRTTNTQHNRDRSSSRKTKHAIHPNLPQIQDRDTKHGCRPSACLIPRSSPIPSRYAEEILWKTGRTAPSFPVTRLQNIDGNLLVKRVGQVFLTVRISEISRELHFLAREP